MESITNVLYMGLITSGILLMGAIGLFVLKKVFFGEKIGKSPSKFTKQYEKDNDVKLITIVNNKKKKSYVSNLFDADDSEGMISMKTANRLIHDLRNIPEDKEIHIIIHTLGGDLSAAEIICRLISKRKGKVTAIVPNYAYSAGTLISLSCDEILTSTTSVFGPVDPQLIFPASSIIEAVKQSGQFAIEHLFAIESEKAVEDVKALLKDVVKFKQPKNTESETEKDKEDEQLDRDILVDKLIIDLVDGKLLHGHPIFSDRLANYQINVVNENKKMTKLCDDLNLV